MKIIDAHHHLWDPERNDHPWLREEPMIPFRYGDYSSIRKPFILEDYDAIAADWDIVASVTMEGEWNPADPTGEAIWMQKLADDTGRPAAPQPSSLFCISSSSRVLESSVRPAKKVASGVTAL